MLDADLPTSDEIRSNLAAAGFTPRHHEMILVNGNAVNPEIERIPVVIGGKP